jgi:hypothetical protein
LSRKLRIEARLPNQSGEGDDLRVLEGAELICVGTVRHQGEELLAIEFQQPDAPPAVLLIRYSDLGLWIFSRIDSAGRRAIRSASQG